MITRYDTFGKISPYGEFIKKDDVEELVDFLYEVMSSDPDTAIDLLSETGLTLLEKWQ